MRLYLVRTFTPMPGGTVEVQNCSLGGHFPKSAFALWQVGINNCIYFSQFALISLIMPRPTPTGIKHEVLALADETLRQSAIAGRMGLIGATVKRILQRHGGATGTLVPGKSTGAPWKTTPRPDCALLRMVRQDRSISTRALTAWMRNLYGMRPGQKTINNRLFSRGYRAYRPTMKSLLTTNHHRLRSEWEQRWQNLTMALWQHVIFGDESGFQLYPVDGKLRVCRVPGEHFQ